MSTRLIGGVGAVAAIAAAGFWFWASVLPVPDNLDTFIPELQRISRISALGAAAAGVAAVCTSIVFWRSRQK